MLRALDEDGNLHDIRVDDAGRLIMMPYGTTTVDGLLNVNQTDSNRIVHGADGPTIRPIVVDALGRLVMIPYGYDGAAYRILRVDELGRMIAVMTGTDGVDPQIILTDDAGRMIGVIRDPTNNNYLGIDADGFMTAVMKGYDGAALQTLKVDDAGRMIALFRDPTSENYAAISNDGFLSAILRGAADVRLGLIGWWRFRSSEGTNIIDNSGSGHDGTAYHGVALAVTYAPGVVGESLSLAGTDEYISVGVSDDYNLLTAFSLEVWFQQADGTTGYLLARRHVATNTTQYGIYATESGDDLVFYYNDGGNKSVSWNNCGIPSTSWHHIIITINGTSVLAYLDGVVLDEKTLDGVILTRAGAELDFGRRHAAAYYTGTLDEIRIYNRVLTPQEAAWRYRRTHVSLDEQYRPLAVDPEGRIEVSIADFAYKDQVLQRGSDVAVGGGAKNEMIGPVPAGKMWVITTANAHSNGSACTSIDIGIYDGADNFIIASHNIGGNVFEIHFAGQLILKPGDHLNFGWGHDATDYAYDWALNGFELDYPY